MSDPHDTVGGRGPISHPGTPSPSPPRSRTRLAAAVCRRRLRAIILQLGNSAALAPAPPVVAADGVETIAPSRSAGTDLGVAMAELLTAQHACDDLLAVVSHEVKTPLTVIRGRAQLAARSIRRGTPLDPVALLETLEIIDASAARIAAELDDLLDETEPDEPAQMGGIPDHSQYPFDRGRNAPELAERPQTLDLSVIRARRKGQTLGRPLRARDAARFGPWASGM